MELYERPEEVLLQALDDVALCATVALMAVDRMAATRDRKELKQRIKHVRGQLSAISKKVEKLPIDILDNGPGHMVLLPQLVERIKNNASDGSTDEGFSGA